MTMEPEQTVTPDGEPVVGEDGNPVDPAGQPVSSPPSPQTTSMPDEAYKGIQRTLEREKQRVRELEAQLSQAASQPADAQSAQIVAALIQEVGRHDPDRAQALYNAYQSYRLAAENQALRTRQDTENQERIYREAQERNDRELRETARAFGADPDSPLIDYGNPETESIAERLARVRASAMIAAKQAPTVTPPARTAIDGQHNTQAGAPPSAPRPAGQSVPLEELERQVSAAQDKYARTYHTMDADARAKADAELRSLNDRLAAAIFA